jgi:hypothetical protein
MKQLLNAAATPQAAVLFPEDIRRILQHFYEL